MSETAGRRIIVLHFSDDGMTWGGEIEVTPLGGSLFRLEEIPILLCDRAAPHDVVSAEEQPDGSYLFQRVVRPGGYHSFERLLPAELVESPAFAALCATIVSEGGQWERVFGGMFFAALPPSSSFDLEAELQRVHGEVLASTQSGPTGPSMP